MKKTLVLIAILLGSSLLLSAQEKKKAGSHGTGLSLTAQVQLGLPQNDFKEIMDGNPIGGSFGLGLPLGRLGLFRIGGEYAWNSLEKEKSAVELLDDAQNILVGDLENSTNVIHYLGYLRFAPFKGGFRPYGEVILGARSYTSETYIDVDYTDGTYTETEIVVDRDLQSTYGYAGGLQVALGRHAFIDARVQVLRGGNVSFVDEGTLQVDTEGEIDYSLEISETDMVIPQVGLTVSF